MKKAFTMIELIFVIIIIGILAAVALPRFSASRADAEAVSIASNLAICINDAGNRYMMSTSFRHITQDDNASASCKKARECFTFSEFDANGTLMIAKLPSNEKKCVESQRIADENILSSTYTVNF